MIWVIVVSGAEHRYCDGTQDSGATMAKMKHQELLKGLIRLHILHHASKDEFYGQWMIHELARHGYTLSPGTLYPMLHSLERSGYLKSRTERLGRTFRRVYRATALGKEANKIAKIQVRELTGGRR
jgi:PadR family transcriptional regulator, regulatory protein PadR